MQFTKDFKEFDQDGNEVIKTVTYTAQLNGGIAEIAMETENGSIVECHQPWKTNGDGSRSDWTSVEEVVEWFKERA